MSQFFAINAPLGEFVLFGAVHWIMLGSVLAIQLSLIFARQAVNENMRRNLRYSLAGILAINEIGFHVWLILTDQWDHQWHLPLHLCSIFVWLSIIMLIWKVYPLFEIAYLLGIAGAIQPLLTTEVGVYGFPHFYAFQIFISHGGIITAAVFMATFENFRPTWASIRGMFLWGNLYMLFVTIVNLILGSNYMYTLHKPHIPTLLDSIGPWPWYILSLEILALIFSMLLYLPFWLHDRYNPNT